MSDQHRVALVVNGTRHEVDVEARRLLVDVLRHDLRLTGTHVGCEHGVCGACTVIVDGALTRSCLSFAVQHDGAEIETVEGLSDGETLSDLQRVFAEKSALQCGFCTAGFLMLTKAFIARESRITQDEVREVVSSNLCRCTGYQQINEAVRELAERSENTEPTDRGTVADQSDPAVVSAGSVTFSVEGPPAIRSAPDIRRVAGCIPGAEVLQVENPTRVAARLRLGAGGGEFCRTGTATLRADTSGAWVLRLEPATDGPAGASVELFVGAHSEDGAARAWITVTPGGDNLCLTPAAARRVEIVVRRVAEQFLRNLDAVVVPVPPVTVARPGNDVDPAGEEGPQQGGGVVLDGPVPSWARRATVRYVGAVLVVAGLALAVRAIRGGRGG